jgi:hypothetical protein
MLREHRVGPRTAILPVAREPARSWVAMFRVSPFQAHNGDMDLRWFACGPGTGHWGDVNLGSNLPPLLFRRISHAQGREERQWKVTT